MTRRTKRLWTDEEKRSICLQTTAPSVSVAQVARRYAMNANRCPPLGHAGMPCRAMGSGLLANHERDDL
jgi:hypothetical protein